jgi:hypothetical protein
MDTKTTEEGARVMKSKLLMVLAAFALLLSAPLAAQVPEDTTNELQERDNDVDIDAEIEADGDLDVEGELDGDADTSADDDALIEDEPDYDVDDDRELPATASPLPLLALLGAGSLFSALGLRLRRK